MNPIKTIAAGSALILVAGLGSAVLPAHAAKGDRPLSKVIIDGKYDKNGQDFDILAGLVQAALDFNSDSPLKVITSGNTKLTVFAPNDKAFTNFALTVTGKSKISEKEAVDAILATVSVDPTKDTGDDSGTETPAPSGPAPTLSDLEALLLGHMVDGTLTAKKLLKPKYKKLTTKVGTKMKVLVKKPNSKSPKIRLKNGLPSFKDPKVVDSDINKGNKQVAHAISQVYLPSNTFS